MMSNKSFPPRFAAPDTEAMSYVGRCRWCRAAASLAADVPGWEKQLAKSVAAMVREGLIVSREPSRTSAQDFGDCGPDCPTRKREPERLL